MENMNKPLKAEVFNANKISIKSGLVSKKTESGAFVYDPKPPKNETPESAEWFAFNAPNGSRVNVFESE